MYKVRFILELINDFTLTFLQHPSSSYMPPSYVPYYPIFLVMLISPSLASLFSLSACERLLFDYALPPPSHIAIVLISPIPYFVPLFAL